MKQHLSKYPFIILCMCIFFLFSGASAAPNNRPLATLEELLNWYNVEALPNDAPVFAADIIIDREITLSETDGMRDLGAINHLLRVTAGGSLTLDNPNLALQGPETVLIVENGGKLNLKRGAVYTGPGNAIVVEQGGAVKQSADFAVIGGTILDENKPEELPPESSEPPPEDGRRPLTNTFDSTDAISCLQGHPPAAEDYPASVMVAYLKTANTHDQTTLSVEWILDDVDFNQAGTYTVRGRFPETALAEQNLSNPNNLTATLLLTVRKQAPITSLTGSVLSVQADGLCLLRLKLPSLPEDVEALYLYRSTDGKTWEEATGKSPDSSYRDFVPYVQTVGFNTYLAYRYKTDYEPIWLRVEVVGSVYEGMSNAVRVQLPDGIKPGDSIHTGQTGDDGGSGGNRGGSGQQEGDRVLPEEEERKPESDSPKTNSKPSSLEDPTSKQDSGLIEPVSEESNLQESISESVEQAVPAVTEASIAETRDEPEQQTDTAEQQKPVVPGSSGVWLIAAITIFAALGALLGRWLIRRRKK